jgi:UDP-glucose 4-epimerase
VPASIDDPVTDAEVNVRGTLHALLAARDADVSGFVFASSNAPLGEITPPAHEEMVPRPTSPYGASKLAGEAYCSAFASSYGLPTVALRFSNVYGPYSYHKGSVVASFCKRALAGEPLIVYGDGAQTRDFVFVDDLCRGIAAAVGSGAKGVVAHLGSGAETTVLEVAREVSDRFGGAAIEHRPARAGDVPRSAADISAARNRLGFAPEIALGEGLDRTVAWFRETGA